MKSTVDPSSLRRIGVIGGWLFAAALGVWGLARFDACEFLTGFQLVAGGRGDNRLVVALLEYWRQAFLGHGSILSPAFYFPAQGVRGYADAFLGQALVYHLLRSFSLDLLTAFQGCVLFFNALNYVLAYFMLRRGMNCSPIASALGAFVFAFSAPKYNQWGHPQMQFLCGLPLVLWILSALARDLETLSARRVFFWASAAGWGLAFQLLSGFYAGCLFLFWGTLVLAVSLGFPSVRTFYLKAWRLRRFPLWGAVGMTVLALAPLGILYGPVFLSVGGKPYSEVEMMIPNLWTYFWMGPRHAWWGWIWDQVPALQSLPIEGEMRMGFGLSLTLLAVVSLIACLFHLFKKGIHTAEPADKPWGAFAAAGLMGTTVFCLLAFNYGGFSPWKYIYEFVPGASALRALGRCSVVLALPLSILLAFFVDGAWKKIRNLERNSLRVAGGILLGIFLSCVLFEQTAFPPTPGFAKGPELARLERLNSKLPPHAGPFYVTVKPGLMTGSYGGPLSATDVQIDAMLLSAVRGIPTLNGYSGANPPNWNLYKVRSPRYPAYVRDWVSGNSIQGPVYHLEIDE
jgi:hypothetical protein